MAADVMNAHIWIRTHKQRSSLPTSMRYILVSPMGDKGAFGNFLRLSAQFGNESGAANSCPGYYEESETNTNELSEKV
jgi:hypothetical protein